MLLTIDKLASHYGRIRAVDGVSLAIGAGELVALVGGNGAGKTTLLRAISGVQPVSSGGIEFDGRDITGSAPDTRVRLGIAQVPEGREMFGPMSVEDNLLLGGYTRRKDGLRENLGRMYDLFPVLRERRRQAAGTRPGANNRCWRSPGP